MKSESGWETVALVALVAVGGVFVHFAAQRLTQPSSTPQEYRFKAVEWSAAAAQPPLATSEAGAVARLVFVGDIMQHGSQADDDFASRYEPVASWLRSADLAIGNLEFPVDPERPVARRLDSVQFNGSPRHLDALAACGFDLLSTANNHCFDQGWDGLRRTQEELARRGVLAVGNLEGVAQETPVVFRLAGLNVGFFAYSFRPNSYPDKDGAPRYRDRHWPLHELNFLDWSAEYREQGVARMRRHAAAARAQGVEVLIALVHWGREWAFQPDENQRRAGRDFLDAGFHIVVGSHGHVLNPVESLEKGLIAYSLGNFSSAFHAAEARVGGLLCVDIARREGTTPSIRFRGVVPFAVTGPGRKLTWVQPDFAEHDDYQHLALRVLGPGCVFEKNFLDRRANR